MFPPNVREGAVNVSVPVVLPFEKTDEKLVGIEGTLGLVSGSFTNNPMIWSPSSIIPINVAVPVVTSTS